MAKKKSSKQKNTPQEFSCTPFKSLKGVSVLAEQAPRSPAAAASPVKADVEKLPLCDGQNPFADEMAFLGVKPLSGRDVEKSDPATSPDAKPPHQPDQSRQEQESVTFLEAIGSVEKVFKDEWPEDEPARQAVPRRIKQVARGQLKPEAELDLHGLILDEVSAKVRFFLQDSIYQGFQTVLIITGKGLHSTDGPVLRLAVEKLLGQWREQVIEWGGAPRRYGGSGALVVFLRAVGSEKQK